MNKLKSLLLAACMAVCFPAGCAKEQQFKAVEQICVPDTGKAEVMQAAEETLSEMYFTIEKADAEQGLIRTRPLAGGQFFEFWRSDNVGDFNWGEANLHTIRRTVELNITQQGEQLCIGCDVKVERLNLPEQEVTSGRAYKIFSESKLSMQTLEFSREQKKGMGWIELGRDTRLETEILKRTESKLRIEN